MLVEEKRGFSLVEGIIYIALISVCMLTFVSLSLAVNASSVKAKTMEEVLYGARRFEQIVKYYMQNESVRVLWPANAQAGGSLKLLLASNEELELYIENARLKIRIGASEEYFVTSDEIKVENFVVENGEYGSGNNIVNISCLIESTSQASREYIYKYDLDISIANKNNE